MPKPLLQAFKDILNQLLEEKPILTLDNASVSLAENAPEGAIPGADADPINPHGKDPVTFSLVSPPVDGSNHPLFAIDSSTGQISLTAAGAAFIDYETTKSYTLMVMGSDGKPAHDQTETLTINLTDVNLAPEFTSGPTGSIAEKSSITTVAYHAVATDDGENGGPLSYSLSSGGDNGLFNINSSTGEVTFKVSPNFEAPGDAGGNNVYDITVHANDGTLDTPKAVAITVTDVVNELLAVAFTDQNGNHTYGHLEQCPISGDFCLS